MDDDFDARMTGWSQDPFHDKDFQYQPDPNTKLRSKVNLWDEYPESKIAPYNQLQTSSCVANSTAAALWFEIKKAHDMKQAAADGIAANGPSRTFIYYNARTMKEWDESAPPPDTGTNIRIAMRSLDKLGDCRESRFPWAKGVSERPDEGAFAEAKQCTIDKYYRIEPNRSPEEADKMKAEDKDADGELALKNLKLCLCEGYPVCFGFGWWKGVNPFVTEQGKMPVVYDIWSASGLKRHEALPNGKRSGHAVIAIGYDDDLGAVICQNSWGEAWGVNGKFLIPYTWITDFNASKDFWTLRHHRQ